MATIGEPQRRVVRYEPEVPMPATRPEPVEVPEREPEKVP